MAAPSTPVAGTPFFDLARLLMRSGRAALINLDPFYPIVPDAAWLARLLPLGVQTIQLRLKDARPDASFAAEIARALAICARHGCQLIVNDYWREAIDTRRRLRASRPGGPGRRRPRRHPGPRA